MKTLYMIGGPMGVGKTTVCQILKQRLDGCVFLDGDWCWDMHPVVPTAETKAMVLRNIRFLLNSFLHCDAYEHVIFCWVLHEQAIREAILNGIVPEDCRVVNVSLVCSGEALRARLAADIEQGRREQSVIARSLERLECYAALPGVRLDTTAWTPAAVADAILALGGN